MLLYFEIHFLLIYLENQYANFLHTAEFSVALILILLISGFRQKIKIYIFHTKLKLKIVIF